MTKFEELQQAHQQLLERMDKVSDKAEFAREVQRYITRVCDEAVDVPAPRDRDQLRANLRFWASYVYDATGTYPNTTMRPAQPSAATPVESTPLTPPSFVPAQAAPSIPPPAPASARSMTPVSKGRSRRLIWGIVAIAALIVILIAASNISVMLSLGSAPMRVTDFPSAGQPTTTPTAPPTKTALPRLTPIATPSEHPVSSGSGELSIDSTIVTQGPAPFDPSVWAARIKLTAQGGNGVYIYWVDKQRLPDASNGEFTVQGQGCEAQRAEVGVTSDGQAASQLLVIKSPLSECP